jgi:hypothetical protein
MRVILAIAVFMSLAGWVWVDAAASGAIKSPIKIYIDIEYRP